MVFPNFVGFMWAMQSMLIQKYLTDEWSYKRRAKSIEGFELKYIDVPWKQDASKTDDNEAIYVVKHTQEYKELPCQWDIGFVNDQMLLNRV